ncbi:hypothetical protein LMG3431_00521 [Achromobacter pestifer]|uniref:Uncharacterized protein n=1 Tax=Achromobacter pestifer TaxID=1353889 RepID=A0A6S6YK09_9BURK|nr:hypothetical protein LMG3431_00521 [Achromobacter pestifer]
MADIYAENRGKSLGRIRRAEHREKRNTASFAASDACGFNRLKQVNAQAPHAVGESGSPC